MKVWVSRYDNKRTISKITALGAECIVAPLLKLETFPYQDNNASSTIIITSSNAIAAIPLTTTEAITVGEQSANILRDAGIKVKASFKTVAQLISTVKTWPQCKMLYLRGKHITTSLKDALECVESIAYSMEARSLDPHEVESVKHANCVMIYSKRSGEILNNTITKHNLDPSIISAIYISEKAALTAAQMPFKQVLIAEEANEDSMMEQLNSIMVKRTAARQLSRKTIYIICGPTASGKSKYALELALQNNGHIINADSMQVYRHLEIITAQPTLSDKALVPHHLYGHIDCAAPYSVGSWLQEARSIIDQTLAQGKSPIVVGGTGMYINALVGGIATIPDISPEIRLAVRDMLHKQPIEALYQDLMLCDPVLAARLSRTDTQRITRGLEVYQQTGIPLSQWQLNKQPIYPREQLNLTLINPPREQLYSNINQRFHTMLENGLLEEVRFILKKHHPRESEIHGGIVKMGSCLSRNDSDIASNNSILASAGIQAQCHPELDSGSSQMPDQALHDGFQKAGMTSNSNLPKAIGLQAMISHIMGEIFLEAAINTSQQLTRNYAKRQITWFKNQLSYDVLFDN